MEPGDGSGSAPPVAAPRSGAARAEPRRDRARHCVVVVAAAGYGTSTWLEAWAAAAGGRHLSAVTAASSPDGVGLDGVRLAIDDLDELDDAAQAELLRVLTRLPSSPHLALGARRPLPGATRSVIRQPILDRTAADLALDPQGTARVLAEEHGVTDAEVAEEVHRLTAGWPVLVHLVGDLAGRQRLGGQALVQAVTVPSGAVMRWLADQVVSPLGSTARAVLELALDVGPLTSQLCGECIGPDAAGALDELVRTGLVRPDPLAGGPPGIAAFRPVPLVAVAVGQARPAGPSRAAATEAAAAATAAWYEEHGFPLAAALLRQQLGETTGAVRLVEARAGEMLARGGAEQVARLLDGVPAGQRSDRAQLILGDARRMAGDAAGAARAFEPLVERAVAEEVWPAALAWRVAMMHYLRAEFRAALDVCASAVPHLAADQVDLEAVQLLAVRSAALYMVGELEQAARIAGEALQRADACGEPRARAVAALSAALPESGAAREAHLRRAHEAAEAAGDVVLLARVLVNQADDLLEQARYGPALEVAHRALRAAEHGAPPGVVVTALYNIGEALLRLGRFDAAAYAFERSVRMSRRAGLSRTAYGLFGQGEVARQLGRREQARMAFEQAIEQARGGRDVQILVPTLTALARLLLDGSPTDRRTAREAADEAESIAPAELSAPALVARGWVALAEGDLALAGDRAGRAITSARSGRSVPALADALELAGAVSADTETARSHLEEALALWRTAGAVPAADRIAVLLGRLPGASGPERLAGREAGVRLLGLGVRAVDGAPALPAEGVSAPVHIRVLGGFEVLVAGRPVPMTAWRSRQARTLVKMLAARRGRPIPRGEVCETLWPDDDPQKTGHRLSVLLSVVRGVLDPGKSRDPDHIIRADATGLSLDLSHVTVDALTLLRDAAHAEQSARSGPATPEDVEQLRHLLAEIDTAYTGAAFEEEPYEAWADALREETRAVWMRALRRTAELSRRSGEHDQAISALVRLLSADPLDESAHRVLVSVLVEAGRHGEARRAFDRWAAAMRSIDAPEPDPGQLRSR